jgi:hypothetical protein
MARPKGNNLKQGASKGDKPNDRLLLRGNTHAVPKRKVTGTKAVKGTKVGGGARLRGGVAEPAVLQQGITDVPL